MKISEFIQTEIILPRLKKNSVLVVYDPDRRYQELCLALAAKKRQVINTSESSISSRAAAIGALQAMGKPNSKLEELRKKIVINDIKKINFNDNNMMKNYNITQNNKNEMKYITKKLDFNFIKNLENKVKISNYGLIKKNKILELIDITE